MKTVKFASLLIGGCFYSCAFGQAQELGDASLLKSKLVIIENSLKDPSLNEDERKSLLILHDDYSKKLSNLDSSESLEKKIAKEQPIKNQMLSSEEYNQWKVDSSKQLEEKRRQELNTPK